MFEFQDVLMSDVHQMFNDWAKDVQLEEVQQTYDPSTGQLNERVFSNRIPAIRQKEATRHPSAMTASSQGVRRQYIVRTCDIPRGIRLEVARIRADEMTFTIRSVNRSHVPDLYVLDCVCDQRVH